MTCQRCKRELGRTVVSTIFEGREVIWCGRCAVHLSREGFGKVKIISQKGEKLYAEYKPYVKTA